MTDLERRGRTRDALRGDRWGKGKEEKRPGLFNCVSIWFRTNRPGEYTVLATLCKPLETRKSEDSLFARLMERQHRAAYGVVIPPQVAYVATQRDSEILPLSRAPKGPGLHDATRRARSRESEVTSTRAAVEHRYGDPKPPHSRSCRRCRRAACWRSLSAPNSSGTRWPGASRTPPLPTTKTRVPVRFAHGLGLLDRKVVPGAQLPCPAPRELCGQLVRVLSAPALKIREKKGSPLLGLVALALILLVARTVRLASLTPSRGLR